MQTVPKFIVLTIAMAIGAGGALLPAGGWSQGPDRLQQIDTQLAEKRAALAAHGKQLEGIKDQAKRNAELRRHFQMTEEVLALMVERRKLMDSGAVAAAPGGVPGGAQGPGGMQHGRGMMEREMGAMQGGGGPMKGMPGMGGSLSTPSAGGGAAPTQATSDMEQMMQQIAQHSAYMDTIKSPVMLSQEMVRHQKMIDQMMLLTQR